MSAFEHALSGPCGKQFEKIVDRLWKMDRSKLGWWNRRVDLDSFELGPAADKTTDECDASEDITKVVPDYEPSLHDLRHRLQSKATLTYSATIVCGTCPQAQTQTFQSVGQPRPRIFLIRPSRVLPPRPLHNL